MKTPPKIEAKIEDEFAASARAWSPEAVYYWDSHLPRYRYFAGLLGDLGARQAFDRVLDIGMGFQTLLLRKLLPESQIDCLGVYHDPRFSAEGKSAFLPGDLNKLAHESGPGNLAGGYDLIVFMEVLEHLYTPPDLVLRYLSSLLSAGGVIVVTTPNAAWLKNRLKMLRGRNPFETLRANPSDMGHIREYTAAELEAAFAGTGLRKVRAERRGLYRFNNPKDKFYSWIADITHPSLRRTLVAVYRKEGLVPGQTGPVRP